MIVGNAPGRAFPDALIAMNAGVVNPSFEERSHGKNGQDSPGWTKITAPEPALCHRQKRNGEEKKRQKFICGKNPDGNLKVVQLRDNMVKRSKHFQARVSDQQGQRMYDKGKKSGGQRNRRS